VPPTTTAAPPTTTAPPAAPLSPEISPYNYQDRINPLRNCRYSDSFAMDFE
jgi:hypothetical protein